MKQYIIIALCILAGKYVDIPVWFNILFGVSTYWAVDQFRRVQEKETCSETKKRDSGTCTQSGRKEYLCGIQL